MRPTVLAATLQTLLENNINVLIEGPPGLGKTQLCQQVVNSMGWVFIQKHAPTMQPEDLALPSPNADRTRLAFLGAGWIPLVDDYPPDTRIGILVDELSQGDQAIQKTFANMVQEKECHGLKIHPGAVFICTGNRQEDRAGANRILSHLADRLTRLEFEPHLDDWTRWALDHDVDPMVISFLRFKPNMLSDFDPQRKSNPSPRSWSERVSPILGKLPDEAEFETIKGAVGEGAAAEFIGFVKLARKLPNPDAILMDPEHAPVPDDPSTLYAVAGAIAHRASEANFDRVMAYARRLPAEFTVLVVRDALRKDPTKIAYTRAFKEWTCEQGADILGMTK